MFDSYEDVEVDVIEVNLGETKEERASYILRTEQEGPEWTSVPEEVLEKVKDAEILITDFAAVGKEIMDAAKEAETDRSTQKWCGECQSRGAKRRGIELRFVPRQGGSSGGPYIRC